MNKLSLFSAIVIILGGVCFHGINADQQFTVETTNFTGKWYAVMATGCSDGKECNIFTNNLKPCECTSAYFLALKENSWQVYMNSFNNQSSIVTVDMGGAAATADPQVIQGFIYSRATMPLSVITASDCGITDNVIGKKFFMRYRISIYGSSISNGYMLTTMCEIDQQNKDKGKPISVIWCRNRTPGKDTIWRQIVLHFEFRKSDIHELEFINQLGCKYPTENQFNEMFFC